MHNYMHPQEACWTLTAAAAVAENCNGTSLADAGVVREYEPNGWLDAVYGI